MSSRRIALVLFLLIAFAGCSRLKGEHSDGGGGHAGPANSNNSSTDVPPSSGGTPTTWQANASSLNGKIGQSFTLSCAPGGTPGSVWGSDIYTADSSICTAAVHSGLITLQQGGTVTIELRAGRPIYGTRDRNGVTTSPYGSYQMSFVFKTPEMDALVREAEDETPVMWNTSAAMVGGEDGKTWKFLCPGNGFNGSVWGTDVYTLDSSICNAAVHSGKFTLESGGPVTIELRPGEPAYKGSSRNGVRTIDYGAYGRSFVVR
jgi:hypothetical protein